MTSRQPSAVSRQETGADGPASTPSTPDPAPDTDSHLASRVPFLYATVRVVPRVEREEFLNAGVILYCPGRRFLAARVELDEARLAALAPGLDPEPVRRRLDLIPRVCVGSPEAGPIGRLPQAERFHWLTAPASTVVQSSPVHPGLSADPAAALDRLMDAMVRPPPP